MFLFKLSFVQGIELDILNLRMGGSDAEEKMCPQRPSAFCQDIPMVLRRREAVLVATDIVNSIGMSL